MFCIFILIFLGLFHMAVLVHVMALTRDKRSPKPMFTAFLLPHGTTNHIGQTGLRDNSLIRCDIWSGSTGRRRDTNMMITKPSRVLVLHAASADTMLTTLQWRHNGRDSVSDHQAHHCLLNCLFRHRSKKTSRLCVTGLCAGNSPGTGEFPAQMASYAENVSIWWRHHAPWTVYIFYVCKWSLCVVCDCEVFDWYISNIHQSDMTYFLKHFFLKPNFVYSHNKQIRKRVIITQIIFTWIQQQW